MLQILGLSEPELTADGAGIAFKMTTTSGEAALAVASADVEKLAAFFIHLGYLLPERRIEQFAHFEPIPATGMGVQAGPTPDKCMVVFAIHGSPLAVEVDTEAAKNALLVLASQPGQSSVN